jgi:hypothetical protein
VVGRARLSRRHERPSWMVVSRRSGKSRPPLGAARLQARVGSGSTSPPPVELTNPGQRTVSCASLAWRALCLLADAPMLPGWDAAGRDHWAQLRRDPRPLPHRAGSATPSQAPVRPGARAVGGAWPSTGCGRSCTALSGGRRTGSQGCEAVPCAWWRRAPLTRGVDRSSLSVTVFDQEYGSGLIVDGEQRPCSGAPELVFTAWSEDDPGASDKIPDRRGHQELIWLSDARAGRPSAKGSSGPADRSAAAQS